LTLKYRSQGWSWRYHFGDDVSQVKNFQLKMTDQFQRHRFSDNTLAASDRTVAERLGTGVELQSLLSGCQIGMVLPEKLQPGPLAGRSATLRRSRCSFFLMFIIDLAQHRFASMNYFFLACSFFAFHLLLAHRSIISPSIGLSRFAPWCPSPGGEPLRLVVGIRSPRWRRHRPAGLLGAVFLCLFLQGLDRSGDHHRLDPDAVRDHADDRAYPLVGEVSQPRAGAVAQRMIGVFRAKPLF
jgi:hypothetical protein